MRLEIAEEGISLLELLHNVYGVDLQAGCLGRGTCGRCRVGLLSGKWRKKDGTAVGTGEALACQVILEQGPGMVEIGDAAMAAGCCEPGNALKLGSIPSLDEPCIAVDLGTTCIEAALLQGGAVRKRASCFNPQGAYGDNVMARISFSGRPGGIAMLQDAAWDGIARAISDLGDIGRCRRMAVAANTVMSCILHGIDPAPMGQAPFTVPRRFFDAVPAERLGMPWLSVETLPCISAFAGGDITAGLCEIKLAPGEMLADIGTNCELVMNSGHGLVCSAASAGPAFEGAGIRCASRALPGAVSHFGTRLAWSVIGGGMPKGICAAALVDLLAVGRRMGRLDCMGRTALGTGRLHVTPELCITDEEIAELLKAKAAIYAGILGLEDFAGMRVRRIYLAGTFAWHLNTGNAVDIGMLPEADFVKIGNSSLAGAARLALDAGRMRALRRMAEQPVAVNLNELQSFQGHFISALALEHGRRR